MIFLKQNPRLTTYQIKQKRQRLSRPDICNVLFIYEVDSSYQPYPPSNSLSQDCQKSKMAAIAVSDMQNICMKTTNNNLWLMLTYITIVRSSIYVDQFKFDEFITLEANRVNLWHTMVLYVLGVRESKTAVCQAVK